MTSSSASVNEAFQEARDQFIASLCEQEKATFSKCSSAHELLDEVKKFQVISKNKQRGLGLLKDIKSFSDSLQPYFKVIEIVIQCDPQWAAIAWGSIRLILQLASNFVGFFEKLAKIVGRIGASLPQYEQIATMDHGKASDRLKSSLCQVYLDLFEFFRSVARVFTNKGGKVKHTPVVIGELFWKPFESRFQDLLEQLNFHRELVKDEFILAQFQQAEAARREELEERVKAKDARMRINKNLDLSEDTKRLLQDEQRDKIFRNIHTWLSPSSFTQELELAQALREERTALWLFEEPTFTRWKCSKTSTLVSSAEKTLKTNLLWLYGNPGSGKTILAGSVIDELRNETPLTGVAPIVCYFFFVQDVLFKSSTSDALRAVLAQLIQQSRQDLDLLDKFSFAMEDPTGNQMQASQNVLVQLLQIALQGSREIYIILDGVDECHDNGILVKEFIRAAEGSHIKILFLSRPNVDCFKRNAKLVDRIALSKTSVTQDIEVFLTHRIEDLQTEGLILDVDPLPTVVAHLLRGADGMFLWARLMTAYLTSSALTPAQRRKAILDINLPEGLEKMYERILRLIQLASSPDKDLASRVFLWLTYAKSNLNCVELREAVRPADEGCDDGNDIVEFDHAVIVVCAGLVEHKVSFMGNESEFRFIHLSVKEYFLISAAEEPLSRSQNIRPLVAGPREAEFEMVRACLTSLMIRTPAQPLSGRLGHKASPKSLVATFPFVKYASLHWIHHLCGTINKLDTCSIHVISREYKLLEKVVSILSKILAIPTLLMAWLEFFNTFSEDRPSWEGLRAWAGWVLDQAKAPNQDGFNPNFVDTCQQILEFSSDLESLYQNWSSILMASPEMIWDGITAFNPSKFFATTTATTVKSLASKLSGCEKTSKKVLCTISELSSDGNLVAILSVWPSEQFDQKWQNLTFKDSCEALRHSCAGWVAKYETWTTDIEPTKIHEIMIPLNVTEIWLQLRQSLRQDIADVWKMQFPLSISEDFTQISILRTIYLFQQKEDRPIDSYRTASLPMDFNRCLGRNWSDERSGFGPCQNPAHGLGLVTHQLYEYLVVIDSKNALILFRDNDQMTHKSILAVFQVQISPENFKISKMQHMITDGGMLNLGFKPGDCALHPNLPLLAFTTFFSINLWFFQSYNAISTVWKGEAIGLHIKELNFSSCGMNLVITLDDNPRPVVRPIQSAIRLLEPEKLEWSTSTCTSLSTNPSATLIPSRSRSVLRSGITKIQDDRSGMATMMLVRSNNPRSLEITRSFQSTDGSIVENELSITALPDWPNIEKTELALTWPRNNEEKITIVLNKATQKWHSFSDAPEEMLPSIIHRDQRAVKSFVRSQRGIGYESINHSGIFRASLANPNSTGSSSVPWSPAVSASRILDDRKRKFDSIEPDFEVDRMCTNTQQQDQTGGAQLQHPKGPLRWTLTETGNLQLPLTGLTPGGAARSNGYQ